MNDACLCGSGKAPVLCSHRKEAAHQAESLDELLQVLEQMIENVRDANDPLSLEDFFSELEVIYDASLYLRDMEPDDNLTALYELWKWRSKNFGRDALISVKEIADIFEWTTEAPSEPVKS